MIGELELRPLDVHFGRALRRWSDAKSAPEEAVLLERLGARLSAELGRQNSCLDLNALAHDEWPDSNELIDLLHRSGLVSSDASVVAPLVLDDSRLYLARYFRYESRLAATLIERAHGTLLTDDDIGRLTPRLAELFPGDDAPDWQRVAAATALDRRLAVIAGGPGTGKTTTVARLLVLLVEQAGPLAHPRIRLAAPTGKAAARLTESLRDARTTLEHNNLAAPEVLACIPDAASTLHRLLAYRGKDNHFAHGPDNPLAADIVVVDEASMVDLRIMAQLLSALEENTRLVLLGDPDQLSSVEAGRVLGDLCAWTDVHRDQQLFTTDAASRLSTLVGHDLSGMAAESVPPLANTLCVLRRSHRFDAGGSLGRFARAINESDADKAVHLLETSETGVGRVLSAEALVETAVAGYEEAIAMAHDEAGPEATLEAFGRFQVLCASHHGPVGVERLNVTIEQTLRRRGLIAGSDTHYAGRLIMIAVNDYGLGLFNGDVGVILHDDQGIAQAWFPTPDQSARSVRASRLPPHDTAFAITVHKSQGSEFNRVLVVLGDEDARLLTRELLYTAVTRSREEAFVYASTDTLRTAVRSRSERQSGLRRRLWPESET